VAAGEIEPGLADLLDCERASMGTRAGLVMLWRADAALALAAKGETADALALAEEQLALAREARVDRVHGVALRTLGLLRDGNGAEPLLREAVTVLERSSARLEHARALIELGAYVRRSGQRGAAREPLAAGHDIARSCGGDALVAQATAELAAAGARPRRPAFSGRDALTPSERRVAEMAAEGLSNPEIAQALFVARKTIEMHLGHVYRKLDVSGREELATALTSNGSG
jgi:DNA-binding CsgD family transcriptional regulator